MYNGASLGGDTIIPLDPVTGNANFSLTLNQVSRYFLSFRIQSTPAQYDLSVTSDLIDVYPAGYTTPTIEVIRSVKLTFTADYNTVVGSKDVYFSAAIYNKLAPVYTNISFSDFVSTSGWLIIYFLPKYNSNMLATFRIKRYNMTNLAFQLLKVAYIDVGTNWLQTDMHKPSVRMCIMEWPTYFKCHSSSPCRLFSY